MLHFIRVYTVWKDKKDLQKKGYNMFFLKLYPDTCTTIHVQWTIPSLLYKIRRKNPLVYKGLKKRNIPRNVTVKIRQQSIQRHQACKNTNKRVCLFVYFKFVRPSEQFLSNCWTGLPVLNQCLAKDEVSSSRTQHSASGEHK